ncbi:MAG TPA: chromate resistance protein ChrB domain-containing protein [Gemmatimonadales bacterium]|nr:chromate resistance protein ChrB domain-containing protein [Gemmatimonadales bacterium]
MTVDRRQRTATRETPGGRWLLLIHQLPPKPDYFRVKIWRRLQRIGAVAIKSSVYVLPYTDQASEDFQWLRREIVAGGGEASVCQAAFVDGLSDGQIEALFRTQRDAEYSDLTRAADELGHADGGGRDAEASRLERRLAEIVSLDHFGAAGRRVAEAALARARERRAPAARGASRAAPARVFKGSHTWVTRAGVHVDRIASAWLIRRFIDPAARFRFVATQSHTPARGEQRFDMFEAEYTHEGDRCSFETLVARFDLKDPALMAIGELVHDIDCKDGKFGRDETAGLERLISGIVRRHTTDEARLERGAVVLEDLYEAFGGSGGNRPTPRRKSR